MRGKVAQSDGLSFHIGVIDRKGTAGFVNGRVERYHAFFDRLHQGNRYG
jgi:hypothetical protein